MAVIMLLSALVIVSLHIVCSAHIVTNSSQDNKTLLCYYTLPCPGQRPPSPLPLPAVNVQLCSHLIISSVTLYNATLQPCSSTDTQIYKTAVELKQQNPTLKILVRAEGNWTSITSDPHIVSLFAFNAGQFLRKYGFDGLEVAWEPPAWPYWGSDTTRHLSYLLLQLNNALQLASHPAFILSISVSASQNVIDHVYDIRNLNQTVDFISVATYDFHTYHSYLPFIGHGAPLKARQDERGHWATLNTEWAVKYWLGKGLPRNKLVFVIPTHANSWRLLSSSYVRVGAPAVGFGMLDGRMTYPQVLEFLDKGSAWSWDEAARVPFAWRSLEWISYEDEASVREKAEMAVTEGLAGVGFMDLNSDDWDGRLPGHNNFPLLKAVHEVLTGSGL